MIFSRIKYSIAGIRKFGHPTSDSQLPTQSDIRVGSRICIFGTLCIYYWSYQTENDFNVSRAKGEDFFENFRLYQSYINWL